MEAVYTDEESNLKISDILLGGFGMIFGLIVWYQWIATGVLTSPGTVMIAVLPIILSVQFLIAFLAQDIGSEPTAPLIRTKYDKGEATTKTRE